MHKLLSSIGNEHGALAKGSTSTIEGTKVIAVNDTEKGGTLYVATTGRPYPIQLSKAGSGGGKVTFAPLGRKRVDQRATRLRNDRPQQADPPRVRPPRR